MAVNTVVIQTAFPGDAILTLPLLQELKKKYPDGKTGVVAIPATGKIFESSPAVDEVFILNKRDKHKRIKDVRRFAAGLKSAGYNKIISSHRSLRSAMIVYFSRIKDSTGFNTSAFPFIFSRTVKYEQSDHEVKRNLSLIDFADDWKIKPEIKISDEENNIISETLSALNGKMIAVAPGSVWATKKYPENYFSELIRKLSDKGYNVVLIGGDSDRELCERIITESKTNAVNIAGKFSIPGTVGFLQNCELLISNDSAPVHMGMAAGVKVCALYCSTVPSFGFYPYLHGSHSIGINDLRCKPCGIHGYKECPEKHFDCGRKFHPDMVLGKIFS